MQQNVKLPSRAAFMRPFWHFSLLRFFMSEP
ncbi:recombination regulator RecX, partial [Salmonella enterica subsp. enterica serovar Enteritidis]|nr:recombination regulator RecX [Salmonella enterica subsp. enterica serovar Enteritidis]